MTDRQRPSYCKYPKECNHPDCPCGIGLRCNHAGATKIKQFNSTVQWHCNKCHLNYTTEVER